MTIGRSAILCIAAYILAVVGPTSLSAQTGEKLSAVRVAEEMNDRALISGTWLVGVHAFAAPSVNKPSLSMILPDAWRGEKACARTTSRDGLYYSLFEYSLPADVGQNVLELDYPTEFEEFVRGATERNTGVAIHLGGCDAVSETFVPAFWNVDESTPLVDEGMRQFVLNLNAGRSDRVEASAAFLTGTVALNCEKLQQGGTSFNTQCKLKIPSAVSGEAEIKVIRYRSGRAAPPRVANVHIHALD